MQMEYSSPVSNTQRVDIGCHICAHFIARTHRSSKDTKQNIATITGQECMDVWHVMRHHVIYLNYRPHNTGNV